MFSLTTFDPCSDLFWKDWNWSTTEFFPMSQKINYPVDIYQIEGGLVFDIAAVGLDKTDIEIKTDGNGTLTVAAKIPPQVKKDNESKNFIQKNVVRKAFNFSWKVNAQFNLDKMVAKMEKGLLNIFIPNAPEKSRTVEIQ
jgi:HSP20 family molecular chaperone IbpA